MSYPLLLAPGIIFLLHLEFGEQSIFHSVIKMLNIGFNTLVTADATWASFDFIQYNLEKETFKFLKKKE